MYDIYGSWKKLDDIDRFVYPTIYLLVTFLEYNKWRLMLHNKYFSAKYLEVFQMHGQHFIKGDVNWKWGS